MPNLLPALPEIVLALAAGSLLVYGVIRGEKSVSAVAWLSVIALAAVAVIALMGGSGRTITFEGLFVSDAYSRFAKILVILGSALGIVLSSSYNRREDMARFEYPILILFATLGMMMMVSANDLISLYLGIELQSLSLYVLAAFRRDSLRSSEAGLKYFVLGALASGLLLYGASFVYGFAGTTSFGGIAAALKAGPSTGVIVGLVFVSAALAFKVSAVPFHMWTPDVYQGAPTPVTAFFSVAPKIAAMALFIRVLIEPFGGILDQWRQIVVFIALASMLLGAFAALVQTDIKRLMAYSSIGHVGYALVGLAAGSESGVQAVLVYLAIYLVMNVGTFAVILCMRRRGTMVEEISDLAGLSRSQPGLAMVLAIFMFSMAGIPPLAGFLGKLYVFLAAVEAGLVVVAVIGVLASAVGAYYYLRIIKIMYFDEPADAFDRPLTREMKLVLAGTGIFTLLFFLYPGPLVDGAGRAAAALFAG
ncbi:MAG: NADH-quinone oxidoreductase subunit NuoN [Alphaproteobacteria bacterium]